MQAQIERGKLQLEYIVSRPQQAFLQADLPALFLGGVGAGKTYAGALRMLTMPAGTRGCVIAPTYRMARDVILPTLESLCAPAIERIYRADMELRLIGDRVVLLRSASHPDRLRGLNLDWLWVDEAAMVQESVWQIALARLRQSPRSWWLTSTPRGTNNWLYTRFGGDNPAGAVIKSRTTDNPYLSPEYEAMLRAQYGDTLSAQELDAAWVDWHSEWFDPAWITYRDDDAPYRCTVALGVDLAASLKEQADYTAIVVVKHDALQGRWYVLDALHGRWSFGEQLSRIDTIARLYNADVVAIESNAYQVMMTQALAQRTNLPLRPVQARADKLTRFRQVAPLYELRILHHTRKFGELESQLSLFPNAPHDDLVDALVYAVQATREGCGLTPESLIVHTGRQGG